METMTRLNDPARAGAYFESKLAFTTGPVELNRMIQAHDSNIIVVDVRAAEDFAKGHIPGAVNLPREKWGSAEGLQKDKQHILYCYSQNCHLAATAALEFARKGYSVMELDGGFDDWKEHDLEVAAEEVNRVKKSAGSWLHRKS